MNETNCINSSNMDLNKFKDIIASEKGFTNWRGLKQFQFEHLIERDFEEAAIRFAHYFRLSDFQKQCYQHLNSYYHKSTSFLAGLMNVKTKNLSTQLKQIERKGTIESIKKDNELFWRIKKI